MKNNNEQRKAKQNLKRNFFREALIRELDAEYRRQASQIIRRGIARKKLSPSTDCDVK